MRKPSRAFRATTAADRRCGGRAPAVRPNGATGKSWLDDVELSRLPGQHRPPALLRLFAQQPVLTAKLPGSASRLVTECVATPFAEPGGQGLLLSVRREVHRPRPVLLHVGGNATNQAAAVTATGLDPDRHVRNRGRIGHDRGEPGTEVRHSLLRRTAAPARSKAGRAQFRDKMPQLRVAPPPWSVILKISTISLTQSISLQPR